MSKFTARCIHSADCTAVMHESDCASLRANLRSPLASQQAAAAE